MQAISASSRRRSLAVASTAVAENHTTLLSACRPSRCTKSFPVSCFDVPDNKRGIRNAFDAATCNAFVKFGNGVRIDFTEDAFYHSQTKVQRGIGTAVN